MGESQSNGIIERAVGLVAGQARTLKGALEQRIWDQSPARRKDTVLAGGVRCVMMNSVTSAATKRRRHTDCVDEGTIH